MNLPKEPSELAKQYIDASLAARARQGRSTKPSKAAYARAVRLARAAMEDLASLAHRIKQSPSH
jgi:hypothetical protein